MNMIGLGSEDRDMLGPSGRKLKGMLLTWSMPSCVHTPDPHNQKQYCY